MPQSKAYLPDLVTDGSQRPWTNPFDPTGQYPAIWKQIFTPLQPQQPKPASSQSVQSTQPQVTAPVSTESVKPTFKSSFAAFPKRNPIRMPVGEFTPHPNNATSNWSDMLAMAYRIR